MLLLSHLLLTTIASLKDLLVELLGRGQVTLVSESICLLDAG